LSHGRMTLHAGGEMWRPIVAVRDAARAYVACLEADEQTVGGQIFNVVFENVRVSEMALRIREALTEMGIVVDLRAEYAQRRVRSYRVSGKKLEQAIGFRPAVSIEESVKMAARCLLEQGAVDLEHPRYYNTRWYTILDEAHQTSGATGTLFGC
jgi:nucleoside-diphosphate-sugar epimerase